jgi:hypothetical protein
VAVIFVESLDSTVWVSAQVVTDFRFLASLCRFLTRVRMSLSVCSRASDTFFCWAQRAPGWASSAIS